MQNTSVEVALLECDMGGGEVQQQNTNEKTDVDAKADHGLMCLWSNGTDMEGYMGWFRCEIEAVMKATSQNVHLAIDDEHAQNQQILLDLIHNIYDYKFVFDRYATNN